MTKVLAKNVNPLQKLKSHTSDVTCVEFWGNILLCSGSSDKTVRIWRWKVNKGFTEESFSPLKGHKYGVTCVKISPQGAVLASSSVDGTIILWDISNGTKTHTLYQENGEAIRSFSFSPDGLLITSADDSGTVCIWDQNKTLIKILRFHEETVYAIAITPDSNVILSACNLGNIRLMLIDYNNLENQDTEVDCSIDNAHDLGVLSADFCKLIHTDPAENDTMIYTAATSGTDQYIKLWRIYCVKRLDSDAISANSGSSSGNCNASGSRLIPSSPNEHVSGESTIYSTSSMNAKCVLAIQGHGCSVTCVRFNSRGTMLVSTSLDKTVKLWDLQGNCLHTLAEHTRYVNCVTINANSSIIASGSNDRTVIIWDLTDSLTLDSHITGIRSIVFNLASSQIDIPLDLVCPITHEIMTNPVLADDGFTYERSAIVEWFDRGKITSPMTNEELKTIKLHENKELKEKIEAFLKTLDFDKFGDINLIDP